MKLAYITATMPTGPGESFLIDEAREIRNRGNEIHIVPRSPDNKVVHEDAKELLESAILVSPWGFTCLVGALREFLRAPWACCKIIVLVASARRLEPIVKNIVVLPKGFWLSSYVRKHGIEHIHCHWAATTATMAYIASKLSGVPWSLTLHRGDIKQNNLIRRKVASSQFARFISDGALKLARDVEGAVCFSNATVIPMGVRVPDRAGLTPVNSQRVVLCPAALIPVKGHTYLIKALEISVRRGAPYEVWFAGDGPLRGKLESLAATLGVRKHVLFMGEIDHARLLNLYKEGRVAAVVIPSLNLGEGLHEGIPVSLMEAMAHGVPVVSTTTGSIPELVSDAAGILVEPGDSTQLANAIESLMQNEDLRTNLGAAGREIVIRHYSVAVAVDGLLDAISGCVRRVASDR